MQSFTQQWYSLTGVRREAKLLRDSWYEFGSLSSGGRMNVCNRNSNRSKADLVMPGYKLNHDVSIDIACVAEIAEPG